MVNQAKEVDAGLATYLAELAETITGRLRPKLAKEEDLYVLAQASSAIADTVHASTESNKSASAWSRNLLPMLQETQSRLISRAIAIVSNDIAHFTPVEEDGELDFPERIQAYKSSSSRVQATAAVSGAKAPHHRRGKSGAGLLDAALSASHAASSSKAQQEKVQLFTLPPALSSTYYGPIGIMLELLYHLQARVPAGAFRRISISAIDACLGSVTKGSQALVKRKKATVSRLRTVVCSNCDNSRF